MIIILVGPPCSGKSTISKQFCDRYEGWERANQDELGNREACELAATAAIVNGKNIIIDRCNIDSRQRKTWINLARKYRIPIDCIVLWIPKKILEDRIMARVNHETRVEGTFGVTILNRFINEFQDIQKWERFNSIIDLEYELLNNSNDNNETIINDKVWKYIEQRTTNILKLNDNKEIQHNENTINN